MTRLLAVPNAATAAAAKSPFDAVLLVGHHLAKVSLAALQPGLRQAQLADAEFAHRPGLWPAPGLAGGRLVTAPTGPLTRDHDDVRAYADAAAAGIRRARDAGARKVLLLVQAPPDDARYLEAARVAAIGALSALWQPLEAREAKADASATGKSVQQLGVGALGATFTAADVALCSAVAEGLALARDLCGADPERMAPKRFAETVQKAMRGTGVAVSVMATPATLKREYPLLSAVARASNAVARHRPCVVRLEYTPKGKVGKTLLLAGKGVTYDTGGADLKVGGHMAGMSRDKGGAAAVAGLFLAVARLRLPGVRLVAELGMVRNSIGADAYVADEIIESHAGVRVRVGNTDAEGRMVLADLLSHLRVRALRERAPELFSVATLTGHAVLAVGPYSVALDNGPARRLGTAQRLAEAGDRWGDPFEVSRLRREDVAFVRVTTNAWDVLQCNNKPSSQTMRGHQFPMAFLQRASGLEHHGSDSSQPLPYTHIDMAGASDADEGKEQQPTGRPLLAMLQALARG
ncbi:MAG: leucyl aminopeptidase family protein [Planctomycetota bacterium]